MTEERKGRDGMTDVSIVSCGSYDRAEVKSALRQVLAPLGGLDWVREGMTVAVKANLVAALRPEKAATTHPAMLAALTELLRERGARVVIGDSPGGVFNIIYVNRVYAAAGLKEAEEAGAELNRDFTEKQSANPEGRVLKELTYTAWLDQADAIIDFCKLKAHGMMGMSGAAKNMFGVVPGTMKPEYHFRFPDHEDFADMIVDLDERFRPRLCLADAVIGMEGNGPTAGTPRMLGFVAAAESPHRLDQVCAGILGLEEDAVPTLRAAKRRGLIPPSAAQLTVSGDPAAFVARGFRHVAETRSLLFAGDGKNPFLRVFSAFAGKALRTKPKVAKAECVGCGVCRNTCPAKAVTIVRGKAVIDRSACIRCFCCQEFCPRGAMKVHRTLLARVAGRV